MTMMHTLTPTDDRAADVDDVARLLTQDGVRVRDADLDPWVSDLDADALRGLYRDMVLVRRIDTEGVALQRQGQLGLWAPCNGQEATQIGTARALRADDFAFPSYREIGVGYARGAAPRDFVIAWRGEEHSTYNPFEINSAVPQIIIGAQTLHAVGYAMGIQRDGGDQVAVAYFGDGATSQGDVNEAMIFASSFTAPVVFVCTNNQWAISEPVTVQASYPIAGRAPGFGIPSMRVDGNDVLACTAAMRWALEHARSGKGPAFIEAVTYRMGPHTTSDDPTRYRDKEEVERWRERDPLQRLETYLRAQGAFDEAFATEVAAAADALAAEVRAAALGATTRDPLTLLDNVYAEPHVGIDEQRERFGAYLDGFADAATDAGGAGR
ncbi:pyruvate dehydrogenase (acetyl-transferring) E1 component subunit alpha [Microbacterium lemovicicum]